MVSLSNIGTAISCLCAENAIESVRVAETAKKGLDRAALAQIEERNAERDLEHVMRTGSAMVEMAHSAVSFVMSCQQLGQAVDGLNAHNAAAPELQSRMEAARSEPSPETRQSFMDADMGGGRTIGERFSGDEVDAMIAPDRTPEQTALLHQAGFDDHEIEGLGGRGAADVLGMNRATPAEERRSNQENAIKSAIQGEVWKTVEGKFTEQVPKAEARANVLGEQSERLRTAGEMALEAAHAHAQKLADLDLEGRRNARGAAPR